MAGIIRTNNSPNSNIDDSVGVGSPNSESAEDDDELVVDTEDSHDEPEGTDQDEEGETSDDLDDHTPAPKRQQQRNWERPSVDVSRFTCTDDEGSSPEPVFQPQKYKEVEHSGFAGATPAPPISHVPDTRNILVWPDFDSVRSVDCSTFALLLDLLNYSPAIPCYSFLPCLAFLS